MAKGQATKEKIINAATKVFSQYGFEAASIKMILQEADVVTGSFYHFFASKEILFEKVIESFLSDYSNRISTIFQNNNLDLNEVIDRFIEELNSAVQTYFEVLEGNKLHWTVQVALHEKTLQSEFVCCHYNCQYCYFYHQSKFSNTKLFFFSFFSLVVN